MHTFAVTERDVTQALGRRLQQAGPQRQSRPERPAHRGAHRRPDE
jgi:hypothetical protein